jgi:hypothetical protein
MQFATSFDTIYVFLSRGEYHADTVQIKHLLKEGDSILTTASIHGEQLDGDTIRSYKSLSWSHDTVGMFFEYHTWKMGPESRHLPSMARRTNDSTECSPLAESFFIRKAIIEVPANKIVVFLDSIDWTVL